MTKLNIKSARSEASFCFYSGLIEISKYGAREQSSIESSLRNELNADASGFDINVHSLFIHEATHYLDVSTTLWGLEFNYRKHVFLNDLKAGAYQYNPELIKAFMISAAELTMHKDLFRIKNHCALTECKTLHMINYSNKHGAYIQIYFMNEDEEACSAPISMLSVLEANAYCSEILLKDNKINRQEDVVKKNIDRKAFENELLSFINDPEMLEYNLIIVLMKMHFSYLSTRELALLTQSLIKYTLNLGSTMISRLSVPIFRGMLNKHIGAAVCEDLCRGASRHVLLLKLIFMLYNELGEAKPVITRDELSEILESSPEDVFNMFLERIGFESKEFDRIEFDISYKLHQKLAGSFDKNVYFDSIQHNKALLNNSLVGLKSLNSFLLPDFVTADETIIRAPKRLDVDINRYFETVKVDLNTIERNMKKSDIWKPHPMIGHGPVYDT